MAAHQEFTTQYYRCESDLLRKDESLVPLSRSHRQSKCFYRVSEQICCFEAQASARPRLGPKKALSQARIRPHRSTGRGTLLLAGGSVQDARILAVLSHESFRGANPRMSAALRINRGVRCATKEVHHHHQKRRPENQVVPAMFLDQLPRTLDSARRQRFVGDVGDLLRNLGMADTGHGDEFPEP